MHSGSLRIQRSGEPREKRSRANGERRDSLGQVQQIIKGCRRKPRLLGRKTVQRYEHLTVTSHSQWSQLTEHRTCLGLSIAAYACASVTQVDGVRGSCSTAAAANGKLKAGFFTFRRACGSCSGRGVNGLDSIRACMTQRQPADTSMHTQRRHTGQERNRLPEPELGACAGSKGLAAKLAKALLLHRCSTA